MIAGDTIAIDSLRLRGPVGDRRRLVEALQRLDWPTPREDAWVFVRRLHVRASETQLGSRLREAVGRLIDGAAPSAPADSRSAAEVVRFAGLTELLVQLSTDLVGGRASDVWYWRQWPELLSAPPAEAITGLWCRNADRLTALTAQLHRTGVLADIWRVLSAAQAERLCQALSSHAGVDLRPPRAAPSVVEAAALPVGLLRAWRPLLAELPVQDPRCWLAAALLMLVHRPLALLPQPAPVLQALVGRLRQPDGDASPHAAVSPTGADAAAARRVSAPTGFAEPPALPASPPTGADSVPTGSVGAVGPAAVGPAAVEPDSGDAASVELGAPGADTAASARNPGPPAGVTPVPLETPQGMAGALVEAGVGEAFLTRQAGLFFLINALNRPEIQAWLDGRGGLQRMPDGWFWLYRLGRSLDLDPGDPLTGFLAGQGGWADAQSLAAAPALPDEAELLQRLADLYRAAGLWGPGLLSQDARVEHTPSHLDVILPMSAVRLELRWAGLDLDPGWVPWLGRVVRFHYGHWPVVGGGCR